MFKNKDKKILYTPVIFTAVNPNLPYKDGV